MLRVGEIVFPGDKLAYYLSNTRWLALKTYEQVLTDWVGYIYIFMNIYIYAYMCMTTIKEMRKHEFEGEQGEMGTWQGLERGKERVNDVIYFKEYKQVMYVLIILIW